jgi:hypothetical protein
MAKVTRREWYRRVNAAWPAKVPPLTADEAVRAARKLYRFAMGYTWRGPVRVTSGRRYTWIRHGVLVVNPEHGWKGLVHLLSHYCHDRSVGADEQGHNAAHARAELRMIKEVIKRGWLAGTLVPKPKPAPVPIDKHAEKVARTEAAIKRWTTKQKRAETALRKLRRRLRALERVRTVAARSEAA